MTPKPPPRPISPLYARYLTAAEKKALRALPVADLASEINLLRVLSAHFLKFQQSAPQDLNSRQQALLTGFILSTQMARLVRVCSRTTRFGICSIYSRMEMRTGVGSAGMKRATD